MEKMIKIIQKITRHETVFFGILSLWLCAEYIILGPFSYVRSGDNLDSIVVKSHSIWDSLAVHGVTYWQPLFAGGFDRVANLGLYSDIYGLIFSLPWIWVSYAILLFLGIFLGGLYTYRLCTEMLGFHRSVGFFAGVLFSTSLIFVDVLYIMIGIGTLPFMLYTIEKIILYRHKNGLSYFFAFGLGIAYALSSSFIVTLPFTAFAIFFWIVIIRKNTSLRALSLLFLFFVPAAILHAGEAYSLLENVAASQRSGNYFSYSIPHYINAIRYTIGENWIALSFTFLGLFFMKKNRAYASLFIAILFLILGAPLYPFLANTYGHFFPAFRNFSFDRATILIPFFSVLSAGFVIQSLAGSVHMTASKRKAGKTYSLQHLVVCGLILLSLALNLSLKFSRGILWYSQGSFLANTHSPDLRQLEKKTSGASPFRLATVRDVKTTLIPTLANFHGFETIDGHANLTTKRYTDFFELLSKEDTVKSSLYFCGQLTATQKEIFKRDSTGCLNPDLLSLANVQYLVSLLPVSLPGFTHIDTGEAMSSYDWNDFTGFGEKLRFKVKENFSGRRLLLYENTDAFPRFFLVRKARFFDSADALLQTLEQTGTTTLRSVAFLETSPADVPLPTFSGTQEQITLQKYSPDEIRISVVSDGPSLLIVSNNYTPNWTATVNGARQSILPAYHTFMAIPLDTAQAEVVLRYEPPYAFFNGSQD